MVPALAKMPRRALALVGAAAALVPSLLMWGFTVDDAFIPLRYAQNLSAGYGWRFNAAGAPTDGVTPLPWVPILALFADGDLVRAKAFGVLAWTGAGAALGARLASRAPLRIAAIVLAFVALAFPIGAWAASGMETGLATALATLAACALAGPRRARASRTAGLFAGLAAAFRPELVPWACVLAAAGAATGEEGDRAGVRIRLEALALALAPFAVCTTIRLVAFGSPVPLAVSAKPSDLSHGATYAGAALVVTLLPILALAPVAVWRAGRVARAIALAFVVHALAVVAVGGDWMPYARLLVPVVPSLAIVFADAAQHTRRVLTAARAAVAAAIGVYVAMRAAPAGRDVTRDRLALVAAARPVLADAKTIAALDVGWVSAAAPHATIVDLAGLTDPEIAALPGGHTSKRVDATMLVDRGVDAVLVYSQVRVVEARILGSELFHERFDRIVDVPVGKARYAVYRKVQP